MNDQELRQLIRESIARHSGASDPAVTPEPFGSRSEAMKETSFGRFTFLRRGDDDGACVIEPSVKCNHCGYCVSYGH